jgi:aspartyl-tRNA(Asn)/glutamyl-tRNA(Gln) amidotransferase subunit C
MPEPIHVDVGHVANLARLSLTEEERKLFETQIDGILEYAEKLKEADITRLETAAQTNPTFDVFREDNVRPGLSVEEALQNAPHQANNLFIVPKVVE